MGLCRRHMAGLAIVLAAVVFPGPSAAYAQDEDDGLDIVSETTYIPDPARAVLNVHSTYTITNERPTEYGTRSVTSYYFDSFPIWLPIEAQGLTASVANEPVEVEIIPAEDGGRSQIAAVSFPASIWLGQSVTVDVDYILLGGGARDIDALTRINAS